MKRSKTSKKINANICQQTLRSNLRENEIIIELILKIWSLRLKCPGFFSSFSVFYLIIRRVRSPQGNTSIVTSF